MKFLKYTFQHFTFLQPVYQQRLYIPSKDNGKNYLLKTHKTNPSSAASSVFVIMMFNHRSKYSYVQVPGPNQGLVLHTLKRRITQSLWKVHCKYCSFSKAQQSVFSPYTWISFSLSLIFNSSHSLFSQVTSKVHHILLFLLLLLPTF